MSVRPSSSASAILRDMPRRPVISIVGVGHLGSALAVVLRRAGYEIDEIVTRAGASPNPEAKALAAKVGAKAVSLESASLAADVLWIAVPDDAITNCAKAIARRGFGSRIALHSSGAIASDALIALRRKGAAIASIHPLMSFVGGTPPSLQDVLFSVEGDRSAVAVARRIARDVGGLPFEISKRDKPLYHAFGAFTSPLLIAHLETAESLAVASGVPPAMARKAMRPIILATLENYFRSGAAAAFSGPLVRGDVQTIGKHLAALRRAPTARQLYLALVNRALAGLPVANRRRIARLLAGDRG